MTITLGQGDTAIEVDLSDDTAYTPEIASDLLRRARQTAVAVHHDVCTATDA